MAYTSFETMRQINKQRYGADLGPMQPPVNRGEKENDLKSAALRFLRERCEGLRHDADIEGREKANGVYVGASLNANQIPYNMQILTTTIRDKGRPVTQDRLFLLSKEEAEKYFRNDADRKTTGRMWWLRDTCSAPWPSAMTVLTDGKIKAQGNVADEAFAVRPAMWVDLNRL